MALSNGGFYVPVRHCAHWLSLWHLDAARRHTDAAQQSTSDAHRMMRLRFVEETLSAAVGFASIDPATLYEYISPTRYLRLPWVDPLDARRFGTPPSPIDTKAG